LPPENRLKCHRQLSASEPRKSEITKFSWEERGKCMELRLVKWAHHTHAADVFT